MIVAYRGPTKDDLPFILATWLRGQRKQGDRVFMNNSTYFENEKRQITRILSRSMIVIVCDPEVPAHLYGYLAYNQVSDIFIIHYAHLKKPYRRLGIMKTLLKSLYPKIGAEEVAITHVNELMWEFITRYKLKFNPYLEDYVDEKQTLLRERA